MDKSIANEVSGQKKRKTILILLFAVAVLALCIWLLRFYFKPALSASDITTSVAAIGNIENTINATGEVLPEFEESLTSPINASIRKVLLDAGNKVKAGESILILDKSAAQSEYDKLKFQIESKENEIRKLKLDLEKSFYDIKSNNSIKQLRIGNLVDAVSSAKRLYKAGGGTKEGIEQAELNLKVAELEKQQLENEIRNKQQTMKIEIREAEIALAIQRNDQSALKRKLDLANVVATRAGVITWVNKNIGASIKEGESLARIADLSSFKIAGSMSDNQLDQLHHNMPVIVRINDVQLRAHIVNISPAVNNGIVSFDAQLEERNNKLLRPNMKVDIFLVTATRNGAVRVANGPAFKGSNLQEIFVLNKGKAERRTVKTGLSNFDYVEILTGIKPGEVVITSDMKAYENTAEVTVNN
ncbi:efflux RND transporter periplasmic adaptor subunit [Pedobacter sp.]|jgi:HlyD family secretion protein|uniref:efflux RND transporter periplasmic adaptor subunit n=1 Tax=Pedobacter sp. TaxID=1411316 RepID=UPI002D0DCFEF|nr:HlyD family efflux transporter periplasmic adaptor subunit [Pedobacter sp.]HWW39056.1 HlyD family efflux transporter periplasmic adaptor subunit [Pedobacter sp.]